MAGIVVNMEARLETLLSRVRADHVSGASETARHVAEGLAEHLNLPGVEVESLRDFAHRAYRARRSMAPLFVLLNGLLTDLREGEGDVRIARRHVLDFIAREAEADPLISTSLSDIVEEGPVLTISNSSAVAKALAALHRRVPDLRVVVMESRPGGEGRHMARRLSKAGVECEIIADSMVFERANDCACAVCGADCVVPGHLVNKVGTYSLALASGKAGIPLHSLAASTKIVGVDISDPIARRRRRNGFSVRSQVFERVPLRSITDLVTEAGVFMPNEIKFPKGPYPLLDDPR
ncbi:MAG: hypothetical protein LUO79_04015 [Methanomassiliicoccales archaeon]|nr:hypothetical protein [Methanomassiliicoccales archaeon]